MLQGSLAALNDNRDHCPKHSGIILALTVHAGELGMAE